MKKLLLMSAMVLGVLTTTKAQDYKKPLKETFEVFDTTMDQEKKLQLGNKLGLIAKKWPNEWATHYYYSLAKIGLSYNERDEVKHDALLDEADKERDEAVALLGKENDETYVLASMIANSRMMINPMQRWQKYGKIFQDNLKNAQEANPDNPRMYYFKGVTTFYTPKNFGGGAKNAMPYLEKAQALFAKEQGGDVNKPYWGKYQTEYYMAECKKQDKEN